jgi:hypothetical protein
MDRKIKERLELALKPAKPPTLEEVPEQVSARGVLRGPVDWVFPAWMLYVEYATQKIAETFPLSEEEKKQLFHFRDAMKRLLLEAWMQAKEKLTTLYKAVAEGTYRVEGKRLYAPDGVWMYIDKTVMHIPIHSIRTETYFPDVLKLSREKLELLQLGWRASDESNKGGRPAMSTTQPWQMFAWATVRCGMLHPYVVSVILTHEGISINVYIKAKSWKQRWSKDEAINLVVENFRRGVWTPMLTMWLGDGKIEQGRYELVIAAKEPWRLGIRKGAYEALVATRREAFVKLREAACAYGELLDLLRAHKWVIVKLAADDGFRATYKLNKKRNIDVLRETYRHNNGEAPIDSHVETDRLGRGAVVVAGVVMYLELAKNTLIAKYLTRDVGKALAIAGRLESAGLRPNVVRSGLYCVVYIAMADLLRLAERNGEIRGAIALYLAEKAKSGTPRQKEIAEKILKRRPLFLVSQLPF